MGLANEEGEREIEMITTKIGLSILWRETENREESTIEQTSQSVNNTSRRRRAAFHLISLCPPLRTLPFSRRI